MPSDSISGNAHFQNFLGGMPPDPLVFAHNECISPLKMPDHLCKGCSSPAMDIVITTKYRHKCLFVMSTTVIFMCAQKEGDFPSYIERIYRDDEFWDACVTKAKRFFATRDTGELVHPTCCYICRYLSWYSVWSKHCLG